MMSEQSSRDMILMTIRRSLRAGWMEKSGREAVEQRLANPPIGLIPQRAQRSHEELVSLFMEMAASVSATVERVEAAGDVPRLVTDYLRAHNLSHSLVQGADPWLADLPWDSQPTLDRKQGRANGDEQTGLSRAFAGVAETGTLVMASGPENPTSVNFLPETHIVAIRADDIVGDYETALGRIRETYGKGHMPRVVNMITGPSRSADIQQTLLLGAHGPRRLHIIVVG
jgi:L-lactate dehydrogenase complex protein LldG